MTTTSLNLTKATASKLLTALEATPSKERDVAWTILHSEVKKIVQIWENIDVKQAHIAKLRKLAKSNQRAYTASSK